MKKNAVDAISAMEISQNDMPTKSLDSKFAADANDGTIVTKVAANAIFIRLYVSRIFASRAILYQG
tara:strand:- start:32 stop:229 length:198 start_codon:yes stop_codon:yes gene_type:complete